MRGLLIGPNERAALARVRDLAVKNPVNIAGLTERLQEPAAKKAHMRQMTQQTVEVPIGYLATFSVERGHPGGVARHLSVSCKGELPNPAAAWMIAEELGFVGSLELCVCWPETLTGRGHAANIVQLLAQEGGRA